MESGKVIAVSKSGKHNLHKQNQSEVQLIEGLGIEGDAHMGKTVKHRSRVAKDPTQPNLRQVHLIHSELHEELRAKGYHVQPGEMGENITTLGVDLLGLPAGTLLTVGSARIQVTGLRNPCHQLERIQEGLMKAVLNRDEDGKLIRKAGIMGIVVSSGTVKTGDKIVVEWPKNKPYKRLEPV